MDKEVGEGKEAGAGFEKLASWGDQRAEKRIIKEKSDF